MSARGTSSGRAGLLARAAAALAVVLASMAVVGTTAAPAFAAAQISVSKSTDASVLVGGEATVTLTVTNPGDENEFNVSFRDQLPPGVTYVPGSTTPAGLGDPDVVTAPDGSQVLLWPDVADVRPTAQTSITFRVAVDPTDYPVGSSFDNTAAAYAQTDPTVVPDFDDAGDPVPGTFTEQDTSNTTTTTVTAVQVEKSSSNTPEGELLRGVHQHRSTYTLTVTNNDTAATNTLVLTDFLPAGLEYLACGDEDNTPGGEPEYPGSGSLAQGSIGGSCTTPATVATVSNPPAVPVSGVFTRVRWVIGDLAPGQSVTVQYAAGIPQRANTMDFPGGRPTPLSLGQGANLDNNSGASTRETTSELALTNYAGVAGVYQGDVEAGTPAALTSRTQHTVTAEDVAMQKSVTPSSFSGGDIATYTLRIRTSEYDNASQVVVTDQLPNGLCPLDPGENYDPGGDPECGTGGAAPTGADYDDVVANPDGSFTITFSDFALDHDGTVTITYQARMRSSYPSGEPTAAGDSFTNHAELTATTRPRAVVQPEGGPEQVTDESEATITSARPSITKLVQPDADPMTCSNDASDYVDPASSPAADVTFGEGDRVCFVVRAAFPGTVRTKDVTIADVLPDGTAYEAGSQQPMPGNTATAAFVSSAPPTWNVGDPGPGGRFVGEGQVFEYRLSVVVTDPATGPAPEERTNRVKLGGENTNGDVGSIRDAVIFEVAAPPPATIEKSATRISPNPGPLTDGAVVDSDDLLEYTLTVGNDGTAANGNDRDIVGPDVWDVLPAGITCADVTAIDAPGACTDPGPGNPSFAGNDTLSAIRWNLPDSVVIAPGASIDLTYRLTVPTEASVALSYTNTGAVASYGSETNTDDVVRHHPADNIDTTTDPDEIDAPAAEDDFTVVTQDLGLTKSALTAIGETNNSRTPGDVSDTEDGTIGEEVTYTVTATVPAHSTVYDGKVIDTPPTGVDILSASVDPTPLPAGFSFDSTTGQLDFPAQYVNGDGTDDVFVITYDAVVTDETTNTYGTVRTNTASFTSLRGPGGTRTGPNATADIRVVEPNPSLTKEDDDPNGVVAGNQVVTFTLEATNAADRPPLHDAYIVDCVPDGITVVGAPGDTPPPGLPATCAAGETLLFWDLDDVDPGETVTLTYQGTIDPDVVALQTLTNTATLAGSSLDDGVVDIQPGERGYTRTASDTLTVAPAEIDKTVDEPTATIGERRTYTATITVPANVNFYDAYARDLLPVGLDPATVVLESTSCTRADAVPCSVAEDLLPPAPGPDGGTYIGISFGDVTSVPSVRTVTAVYSAVVADVPENVAGESVDNEVQAQWNTTTNDPDGPANAAEDLESRSNLATATVLVVEPDLTIDKSVSDGSPAPGDTFTYTVVVGNQTGSQRSDAFDVTVVDTIPTGVVVDAATISNGGVLTGAGPSGGGTITWQLAGPIAPGAAETLTYDAELSSPPPDSARTNTADITDYFSLASPATSPERREYDGPQDTATVAPAVPHVTVTKDVVGGDLAYIGESKAWRITVISDGDVTAENVSVSDVLPPSWTYDGGSALVTIAGGAPAGIEPGESSAGGVQTLTWTDLADLAVGDEIEILFTATPGPGAVDTPGVGHSVDHVNTASVTAQDAEGSEGPPSAPYFSGPDDAIAHIDEADVEVEKSHTGDAVAGEDFSWTVSVSNGGQDTAVGPFTVTDTYPPGLVGPSASGPGWDCSTGATTIECTRADPDETLASGASFPDIIVTGAVPAGAVDGTEVVNHVEVTDRTYDPDLDNNEDDDPTRVTAEADLAIVKTLTTDLVAGENATYSLDMRNNGPSVHRGLITVTDTVPDGTTFVSQTAGAGWTFSQSGALLTWTRTAPAPIGPLPHITVTVHVDEGRTAAVTNAAEIDGTLPDPVPGNNEDDTTDTPDTLADLILQKRHTGGTFTAGGTGTYRFSVLNAGPSTAQPVVTITDTLPAGLTFRSFDSIAGTWDCFADDQDLTCELTGPLGPGAVVTVDVVVDIDPAYPGGPVHNEAHVESPTTDPVPPNNDDDDDTDVDVIADLAIEKSHAGTAIAGEAFQYDLRVTNNGSSSTTGPLTVHDLLPAGMTYSSASGASWSCTPDGGRPRLIHCTYAAGLTVGASSSVLVLEVDVASDAGPATLVNRAVVEGPPDGDDDNLVNNLDTDPTVIEDDVEISVDKTVTGANPVLAGNATRFAITARNDGPSAADDVTVVDVVPPGTSLVSATGAGWTCTGTTTVTCVLAELAPGTISAPVVLVLRVGSGVPSGTVITNTATVATSTDGDTPAGNTDSADVTVTTAADLELTKQHPGGPQVVAGETTRFTIRVRNLGPSDAQAPVRVVDDLPAGMSYVSADGGWSCTGTTTVTCTLPSALAAGTTAPTLGLTVLVSASATPGTSTNTAEASSPTVDPDPSNNDDSTDVVVVRSADLSITKTHTGQALVGEQVDFQIVVHNDGPSDASGVVVGDTVPAGLSYVSASGSGWTCNATGADVTCALAGVLAAGADAPMITLTVDVLPAAYPEVTNTADVTADPPDDDPSDNTDSDTVEVPPLVNLTLGKRHLGTIEVGQRATYVLVARNEGPTPDPGPVTVVDRLPRGLSYVSARGAGWSCENRGQLVRCERPALAVGQASRIVIVADVLPAAYPTITNTAVVRTPSDETDLRDNPAADRARVVPLVHLAIEKEPVRVTPEQATWDITVTNDGPNVTSAPIVVVDDLPDGLQYESAGGPGWNCGSVADTVTCTHDASLDVDESSTIRLRTSIEPDAPDQITNVATASGGGDDDRHSDDADIDVPAVPGSGPADGGQTPGNGPLPGTGGPAALLPLLGLLLLTAGGALVLLSRRRGRTV